MGNLFENSMLTIMWAEELLFALANHKKSNIYII